MKFKLVMEGRPHCATLFPLVNQTSLFSVSNPGPDQPRIAVVIIGRNEAAHLRACIESVRAMHYPAERTEVIYVDSESSDSSAEIAEALGVRTIRLRGAPRTAARGRNAGWRATDAELVLFLDGDVILDPSFVEHSVSHFCDPALVCVWGTLREQKPTASIFNRVFDLDWVFPAGLVEFFGGIALVRRAGLEAVGGYNETLGAGEEPEVSRRLRGHGWKILHTDSPMALHDLAMVQWKEYWQRLVRSGRAYAQVAGMYAHTEDPMWSDVSRRNLVRGIFWMSLPAVALGVGLLTRSALPLGAAAALSLIAVLRTAWKARPRSDSWLTLLLFGLHAHFQEIPILLGQMRYWRNQRARS